MNFDESKEYKITLFKNGKPYDFLTVCKGIFGARVKVCALLTVWKEEDGWTLKPVEISDYEREYGLRTSAQKYN